MAITSAEIHNQSFSIDRKGYDVDEVDVFLEHVADEIDGLIHDGIISGGMLIPGNIPNIICASKLGIKSKDWAKHALGIGGALLIAYFIILSAVVK